MHSKLLELMSEVEVVPFDKKTVTISVVAIGDRKDVYKRLK